MREKIKIIISDAQRDDGSLLSRRGLLKGVCLTGAALVTGSVPGGNHAATPSTTEPRRMVVQEAFETLTAAESATLDAFASRILPSEDGTPGAWEARAVHFIDRALAGPMAGSRELYAVGLAALDALAVQRGATAFHTLPNAVQDEIIDAMTRNAVLGFPMLNTAFFNAVRNHTIEGCFCDPYYGGNRDFVGWQLIGYPGVRIISSPDDTRQGRELAPSQQSAYDMPAHTKDVGRSRSGTQGGESHGH